MAVFKKDLTALSKGGSIIKNAGKGASSQPKLARGELNTLTKGDPAARTMQNYAKATPMANPIPEPPSLPGT